MFIRFNPKWFSPLIYFYKYNSIRNDCEKIHLFLLWVSFSRWNKTLCPECTYSRLTTCTSPTRIYMCLKINALTSILQHPFSKMDGSQNSSFRPLHSDHWTVLILGLNRALQPSQIQWGSKYPGFREDLQDRTPPRKSWIGITGTEL